MKLKAFEYLYSIRNGCGMGIVFAKTKEDAIKIIEDNPYAPIENLDVKEIDISKTCIFDHSWSE